MCNWSTITFSCGHHDQNIDPCRTKQEAAELGNPFWHATPCNFQESYSEQLKSCPLCTAKIQATIFQGQQHPHVLGHDPRDTLPSQNGRKVRGATRPPLPPPRLAGLVKKRNNRQGKTSAEATALEWAQLSALRDNTGSSDDAFIPANGIVKVVRGEGTGIRPNVQNVDGVAEEIKDNTEKLWVTAAAHRRMRENVVNRRNRELQKHQQKTIQHTIPRKATRQQDLRTRDMTGTLREAYRAAEPSQESYSTGTLLGLTAIGEPLYRTPICTANQEPTEMFLNSKLHPKAEKLPPCLAAGSPSARLSRLSLDFDAARSTRQDISAPPEGGYQALNTTDPYENAANVPSIFVSMFESQNKQQVSAPVKPTTSVVMIASQPDVNKHQSLPYQLPVSKRMSTLHFEAPFLSLSPCEISSDTLTHNERNEGK